MLPTENGLIVFVHIPKAAGMTLHNFLAEQFGPSRVLRWRPNPDGRPSPDKILAEMPAFQRNQLRAITGHFLFGLHAKIARPCWYLTVLRHPVERLASHYTYVQCTPGHLMHHVAKEATFDEYATSLLGVQERDNGQLRQIAAADQVPDGALTTAHLRTGIGNLEEHFPLVGVQDRFDRFVGLVSKKLNIPLQTLPRQNASPSRSVKISPMLYRKLIELNCFDWALYEWARKRQEELEAAVDSY